MKKLLFGLFLVMMLALVGCSSGEQNQSTKQATTDTGQKTAAYEEVDIEKAKELVKQGATIIDVRTPEEFAAGHIPDAILIPLDEVDSRLTEFNPDETYVMVCRSSNRSGQASEILVKNGVTKVYNMLGGMNVWDGEIVTE